LRAKASPPLAPLGAARLKGRPGRHVPLRAKASPLAPLGAACLKGRPGRHVPLRAKASPLAPLGAACLKGRPDELAEAAESTRAVAATENMLASARPSFALRSSLGRRRI